MLEVDANLCSSDTDPALTQIRLEQYNRITNEMHLDDLPLLEKDLEFYEKVSLLFLLNAHSQESSHLLLQRLTVALHSQSYATNYLQDWARFTSDWARTLVEALAIVQSNRVLRKLGLDTDVISELDILPRRPDIVRRIHPIVKWLHHICEHLNASETRLLINFVCVKFPDERYRLRNIPEPTERYLEMWLLVWLSERLIDVGDWAPGASSRNRKIHCRLDAILIGMKTSDDAKLASLHHRLESAQIRFNCTSMNVITFEPKTKEMMEKQKAVSEKQKGLSEQQLDDGDATVSSVSLRRESIPLKNNVSLKSSSANSNCGVVDSIDVDDDSDRYKIRTDKVGIALIINQDTFHKTNESTITKSKKPLEFRRGSRYDKEKIAQTLSQLGYICVQRDNLTARQTEEEIRQTTGRCGDLDSMVVCILSHGFEGHVYASDTVAMKIERIEQLLAAPTLLRKPKLLIVQACQGEETQELMASSSDVGELESDGPVEVKTKTALVDVNAADEDNHPLRCDMCVAMSTIPGYVSYRNTVHGSWFVQTLCEVMTKSHQSLHFIDMLTKVCFEISKMRGNKQESMVPRFASSLRKQLFFSPSSSSPPVLQ